MKIKRLLFLFSLPLLLAACTSYKNVPYLQNPEVVNDFGEILPLYDAKIMPKDLLSITVNTTEWYMLKRGQPIGQSQGVS